MEMKFAASQPLEIAMPKTSPPGQSEASRARSSAWSKPVMRCEKWKKKEKLSERSEFFSFPFFASQRWGPRKGLGPAAAFFCLLFLAEQEK
ncbi:hypothetical protein [Herbaspirillum sp. RV1423]|uniref:hypothetical protein n=1 Tax=Herbaspirillum sp. RV1423 TaxID=1443993 RepID=UPI00054F4F5D|nr:hypothetical protein [Herbaspirillum sp. RV1423]